ncbi:N-acetylmuramoyl-L-alanine amidase [Chlamydia abortus]|nr:N-acetylmuramoyl-L-alanine amidase [Chlamydia abortus]
MTSTYRSMQNGRLTLWLCATLLCWIIGSIIYIQPAYAAENGYKATVDATSLNVREEPAAQGAIIGSLKQGTEVEVLSEKYGWAEIQFESGPGWVAAHYLIKEQPVKTSNEKEQREEKGNNPKPASEPKPTEKKTIGKVYGIVSADALRLREEPDLEADIVDLLPDSSELEIVGQAGEWLNVITGDGQKGWVSGEFVVLKEAPAKKETAETSSPPVEGNIPDKPVFEIPGLKNKVIVIDPGHGGSQPGTIGVKHGTLEKDLNLSTALLVAESLRAAGAKVYLTRDKDQFLDLSDRVDISHAKNADAFISIHYNSAKPDSSGIISFYHSEKKDKSLAKALQQELVAATDMKNGGDRFGDYHVLRHNSNPSVLLELGFLSNPNEEEVVRAKGYRLKVAKAIVAGLQEYFGPES